MLKHLIDTLREQEGYAGMAVYLSNRIIFYEMLEPELLNKIKTVFEEGEAILHAERMMAVIHGYTINAFKAGDALVICRLEGRFTPALQPDEEEPSYTTGHQKQRLIEREEARKEAENILKLLMKNP
ncbi:hypothetical protein [Methanocella conradii]|uniref:hypothetical protein n=1 Tax=Methanocella conradii TaxID=1175444 RepID=UPI0024B3BF44|nr:hypothetical protein [Methanocella conradii]MDI6897494.1 hypothetical protein [Methanocella conradii]